MKHLSRLSAYSLALLQCGFSLAGTTDIANVPLGTSAVRVKPNIMFILDDSGSMASRYMPDDMSDSNAYGYRSSQCNGIAYDPRVTYRPPVDYQGNSYPNASFTAAWNDGFNTGAGTTNLAGTGATSVYWSTYYTYSGTQPKMGWVYAANGSVDSTSTFYTECTTSTGTASTVFTAVRVTAASADAQNFANWFAYYRTRLTLMRTAVGHAFASLDDKYRVGFTMISDSSVTSTDFLDAADYVGGAGNQREKFYTKLYNSYSGSYTPLRGALSKVGQYYGMSAKDQTYDPVQYSCQRNYAILSTDGYWNTNIESSTPGSTYGPYKLDRSTLVGQQDGTELRPMKDSATITVRTVTVTARVVQNTRAGTGKLVSTAERTRTVVSNCGSGASAGRRTDTRNERATMTVTAPRTLVLERTRTDTQTVVQTNGVTTSDSTTSVYSPSSLSSATVISDTVDDASASAPTYGSWSAVSGTSVTGTCVVGATTPTGTTYSTPTSITTPTLSWSGSTPAASADTVMSSGTPTVTPTTTVTGGSSNSLADVAQYYWNEDLRPSMPDNVPVASNDASTKQHMNTFTLGLGVKGTLTYTPNYLTQVTGDFADLKSGTKNWPNPGAGATMIDDLWHTAVNGRGQYFSATDPSSLVSALTTTLAKITEQVGAGAAAAASTLTPTVGDDWIFLPSYVFNPANSLPWHGDLRAFNFTIDPSTKTISVPDTTVTAPTWSAKTKLDARDLTTDDRTIYFNRAGTLTSFTYANLTAASLNTPFDNRCTTATERLSQCASLVTYDASGAVVSDNRTLVTGTNLVNFLRGDTSLYLNSNDASKRAFRSRASRLGDFVNASPVYVGKPPFKYADTGYASFVSANANRSRMVYAGANDGMLHAFKVGADTSDSAGGTELWAFVPTAVIGNMWRLADSAYDSDHRFYVDATPVVADVYDAAASQWRTILVGGLGAGGRAYYALDITSPESPRLLWEINTSTTGFGSLGLTYGNPVITKNRAGTWVVAFTSGLNNVSPGDGVGRLYVVNAISGALINTVSTGAGDTGTPSGLTRIEAWINATTDNTALRFYGGDLLGNLWRFDHDDRIAPTGAEALRLGIAQTPSGAPQPVTTKPVVTEISNGGSALSVISFGTGRYLGTSDVSDNTLQTIYTIKDTLGSTGAGNLRDSAANMVEQVLNSARKIDTPVSVDWGSKNGWFVDLDRSNGERVAIDGLPLSAGVVAFTTTVPTGSVCSPSGVSYLYQFAINSGKVLKVKAYDTLLVGLGRIMDANRQVSAISTRQDQRLDKENSDPGSMGVGTSVRRSSWRELIN